MGGVPAFEVNFGVQYFSFMGELESDGLLKDDSAATANDSADAAKAEGSGTGGGAGGVGGAESTFIGPQPSLDESSREEEGEPPSSTANDAGNCLGANKRHTGDAPFNQPIVAGVFPQENVGTLT